MNRLTFQRFLCVRTVMTVPREGREVVVGRGDCAGMIAVAKTFAKLF